MKPSKKFVALCFAFIACALFGAGCNTMKGVGKDVEKAGDKIQDAAR